MTGQTGWQGGLIRKGKNGYLIPAFSGGPFESDLKVSQAGLEVLVGKFAGEFFPPLTGSAPREQVLGGSSTVRAYWPGEASPF